MGRIEDLENQIELAQQRLTNNPVYPGPEHVAKTEAEIARLRRDLDSLTDTYQRQDDDADYNEIGLGPDGL